jgi:hypothetical protein
VPRISFGALRFDLLVARDDERDGRLLCAGFNGNRRQYLSGVSTADLRDRYWSYA